MAIVMERDAFYIDGRLTAAQGGEDRLNVVSPATESRVGSVPLATAADVDAAVTAARGAFDGGSWPATPLDERIAVVERALTVLAARSEDLSVTITTEMGIPVKIGEPRLIQGTLMFARSLIESARKLATAEVRHGTVPFYFRREPLGVVGAIVPWNAPFLLAMNKICSALLMGSTVVYKPAAETPLSGYYIAEAFSDAGLPPGALNLVPGGAEIGDALVNHPGVDKISFTGSTAVGRRVGAACGQQLKRFSLELGGKSSAIILDDADLDAAVPMISDAAFWNSGQICVATQRVLTPRHLYDEVVDRMARAASDMVIGDPLDAATDIGPLVASRQRERVEAHLARAQEDGAKIVVGGGRPDGAGWFIEPTVLRDVESTMPIAQEETFGPVASVIAYDDVDQAVRMANDTEYGLGGSVFSADDRRAIGVAERIHTGIVMINEHPLDAGATVGGRRTSGIGTEGGPEGLAEFTEYKMISLPPSITSLDQLSVR